MVSHCACSTRGVRDRALHEHRRPSSLPSRLPNVLSKIPSSFPCAAQYPTANAWFPLANRRSHSRRGVLGRRILLSRVGGGRGLRYCSAPCIGPSALARFFEHTQPVPGVFQFAGFAKRALLHKIVQVSRGGSSGGGGYFQIVLRTESAFKPFKPFSKHAFEHFLLSRIELAPQAVVEFGFLDKEVDQALRVTLCVQYRVREVHEPVGDF